MVAEPLAADRIGSGRRLALVHGFTQTSRSWQPLADRLAPRFEVLSIDAPGHGDSAHADADVATAAVLVGATAGRASYVGYSMGGRICLQLALDRPDLVERLVLISSTAGIDDEADRAARRADDDALATTLELDGLDAFLRRWVTQPLLAGLADPDLEDRRRNSVQGLAASLRHAGTGMQAPVWDRLDDLAMPVLVVVGAGDAKFRALGERLVASIPDATLAVVDGAGHTVHLEQPDAFGALLDDWLSR